MIAERKETFVSRRAAAKLLAVTSPTLDRLANFHGLTIRQVPGHNRKHFLRAEIEALAARAEHIATEARAATTANT